MKYLLLLTMITALVASPVFSQTRKKTRAKGRAKTPAVKAAPAAAADDSAPPPPPVKAVSGKQKPSSAVTMNAAIGEWGVASLTIPDDLTNVSSSKETKNNKNVSWTTFARYWKQPAIYYPSALEVDLTVTTWNNPITEVIPDLRPDLATPEHLVLLDLIGDENSKNRPNSPVKEAKALEISNLKGAFFRADSPVSPKQFTIGWGTYRYYNGKLQNILLSISGNNDELEKALKIMSSLKLE